MPEFKCQHCAKCCSNIKGFKSEKDKEFALEYAFGKLPIFSLLPLEDHSYPLWDFEAKRLIKDAEEKNIQHKIQPAKAIFDLNTNQTIITNYSIDNNICTFLEGNRCRSYEKRGFICKMFPFQHGPFLKIDEFTINQMFGSCPSIKDIIDHLETYDKKKFSKQLYERFGDSFLAVLQADYITEWINKTILELMKTKKLRPAINYPYDLLLKRVNNSEKIDFMDYLVQINKITEQEKEELINKFLNNKNAKEKLDDLS